MGRRVVKYLTEIKTGVYAEAGGSWGHNPALATRGAHTTAYLLKTSLDYLRARRYRDYQAYDRLSLPRRQ